MPAPPGSPLPASIQTALYLARPEGFMRECHRRYGDVFTLHTVLFGPEVCFVRPEMIKTIFTGDPDALRAGEANSALEPVVGKKSVLLLDGAEHLRHRRLMLPPFHGERMLAYADTMREITDRVLSRWPIGKPFALHAHMQHITLEVILRTIFGVQEGAELSELHAAIARFMNLTSSPAGFVGTLPPFRRHLRGLSPWAFFLRERDKVDRLIYAVIERRRRAEMAGRTDILSLMLAARDEHGNGMTDRELRDELMTLLVAGHETTATELCWAFDKILRDERVLRILLDEVTSSDRSDGPYLDATLKEVLRLAPVIPAVGRRLKSPTTMAGFDLPAGVLVVPALWLTHRLPDVYPEPEAFRPERFLDKKPDPYAWLPFGGGIRRCLGMAFALFEMKVVLASVLKRVRMRPVSPRPARVSLRSITHSPSGGVKVIVEEIRKLGFEKPTTSHHRKPILERQDAF